MNNERFTPNNEQDAEKANLENQKGKLVGFYLNAGDEDYIFRPSNKWVDEADMPKAKNAVLEMMQKDMIPKDTERRLLANIAGPDYLKGNNGVFEDLADDKHKKRILGYMTGERWGDYDKTSGSNVSVFLSKYPTPMDFEGAAEDLLTRLDDGHNSQQKIQEYYQAMDEFQRDVYGKRYEYFKAIKDLHREATELGQNTDSDEARKEAKDLGYRFFEIFNREKLVKDSSAKTLNKGRLTGQTLRKNEDSAYCNPNIGVFAVYDGAGGEAGDPARASQLATHVTDAMVEQKTPNTTDDLKEILEKASETIWNDPEAGISTAVIGKIRDDGGHKTLVYASAGDSRIYVVRQGEPAIQVTKDEGEGHHIENAIGVNWGKVKQFGEYSLQDGDRLVFCSDGITGDYEKDFIPNDELAHIVLSADDSDAAAAALIKRATKIDDRTVIVAEV